MPSISDTFVEDGSDKGDRLGLVENETPGESFLGERADLKNGRCPYIQRDEVEDGPGGGRVCPVLVEQSSWFGIKPLISPTISIPHADAIEIVCLIT